MVVVLGITVDSFEKVQPLPLPQPLAATIHPPRPGADELPSEAYGSEQKNTAIRESNLYLYKAAAQARVGPGARGLRMAGFEVIMAVTLLSSLILL